QLDSLRDITKSAIGAKDNDALSKPIFEGTLLWGRDLDGKAVLIEDWRKKVMATSKQDRLQMLKDANRITPAQLQELAKMNNIQANRFINGIIDEEVSAGLVWTDSELRSKFDLSDEQIELYREFRSATDKSLDSLTRSDMLRRLGKDANDIEAAVMEAGTLREAVFNIEQHINSLIKASPKKEKALKQTLKDIKESQFRTNKLMDDGYAPLSRFGQYTVDVVDSDGNREYFGMFESAYEARKMEAEMKALYDDPATHTVSRGTLSNEEFKLFAGVTPETAELFGEMLGLDATGDKAADEAFQEYLKRTKNNRSAMKRLMHRKGIKGYSEDVGRVLASFIYSNARHTSAALNMSNIDRAITDIPKGEGQLKDAAVKLAEYIKNPQEEAQLMRGWMFAQYLGGSIASAVVNITQPIAVSFPYLSQFGGAVKAASQLGKASSDWTKAFKDKDRGHFEPDLLAAIERAEADGTLSPQEVHNLLKQASGKNPLSAGDGTKVGDARALAGNTLSRVSLAWGSLFSGAEQINRRVTFVAAYRLAKEQGMDNPAEFATKSIKETQFVYNKASRMNWGRGAVGGTLMTFKTYTVSYIELMHRLWNQGEKGSVERAQGRKATMIMLGVMFMLSGSGGLPFMEDAEDLIDGIGQIMGYNLSSKKARQDFLDAWFGEMLGDFLESGASTLPGSPTDVSGRLGLGNLIPGTGILKERTNNTRDVLEIAGPAGDFAGRIATGTRDIAKGVANLDATSLKKGALEFAPTAVRNAVKGVDMASSGIYKDTKGYKVTDVSPVDAAFKFAGFQPLKVSKIQEANYLGQTATSYYSLRASNIRALWAAGVVEGNSSKVADAKAAVKDWNEKNPDQKIVIRPTDIARRVREMKMDKSERVTKLAPKSMRAQMASDFSQVRDGF
ncbi:PLxRFG domain-containing protein, partial [Psychrobacter sp.]|uniref:PLxRFG domain-containing protein n=1 Tax=Psychrobacter sp. TaxID=56811 RepID=UPI002FD946D6